ncbi:MAG: hypothetical protein K2W96_20425 [Gemmataceae bacterium]|nr:hypothetical protein [Gemmataceae bacterium]
MAELPERDCAWTRKPVFLLVGGLFLAAGLFKVAAEASRPGTFSLALVEIAFGAWLASGWLPCVSGQAGLAVLGFFLAASLWSALAAVPCGCFGDVPVSPWPLAAFDAAALVALACQPTTRLLRVPLAGRALAGTALALSVVLVGIEIGVKVAADRRPLLVIATEEDVGGPLGLLAHAEGAEALASGDWVVVVHRSGCSSCERLLAELAKKPPKTARVALLDVPNGGSSEHRLGRPEWLRAVLSSRYRYAGDLPAVVRLDGGVVMGAGTSLLGAGVHEPEEGEELR